MLIMLIGVYKKQYWRNLELRGIQVTETIWGRTAWLGCSHKEFQLRHVLCVFVMALIGSWTATL